MYCQSTSKVQSKYPSSNPKVPQKYIQSMLKLPLKYLQSTLQVPNIKTKCTPRAPQKYSLKGPLFFFFGFCQFTFYTSKEILQFTIKFKHGWNNFMQFRMARMVTFSMSVCASRPSHIQVVTLLYDIESYDLWHRNAI